MGRLVFVTGASGKVGLRLVEALAGRGDSVVGLARGARGVAQIEAVGGRGVVGTLGDRHGLAEAAAEAATVVHLAGGIRGEGTMDADRLNRVGTESLLVALGRARARPTVVFTSSVAVYGDCRGRWMEEDDAITPDTRYGRSKLAAEGLLLDAWRREGLPVRIARLAAVYGPGFPFLMAERIATGRVVLPGPGANFVPTIHVDDAVAGLLALVDGGADGTVTNLADPNPVTMRTFYGAVARRLGRPAPRFAPPQTPIGVQAWAASCVELLAARTGRRPRITADAVRLFHASCRTRVGRLATELDFRWRYPTIEEGLAATLG